MYASCPRVSAISLFLIACSFGTDAVAEIHWLRSPEKAFQASHASGKPILVFVTADWCHYCQKMKRETWSDAKLSAAIRVNFQTLLLDGDKDKQIVKKMEVRTFPATLVYNREGVLIAKKTGFMGREAAATWLRQTLRR